MIQSTERQHAGLWAEDVLADLSPSGPVHVGPDERLWKLHIFRPATGRATHLEHRIYSKRKASGKLALVTFATHRPLDGQTVRSGVAQVPELSEQDLEKIIESIKKQTGGADECFEIDLSHLSTWPEQLEYIRQL
jgi:hypothetical protein